MVGECRLGAMEVLSLVSSSSSLLVRGGGVGMRGLGLLKVISGEGGFGGVGVVAGDGDWIEWIKILKIQLV